MTTKIEIPKDVEEEIAIQFAAWFDENGESQEHSQARELAKFMLIRQEKAVEDAKSEQRESSASYIEEVCEGLRTNSVKQIVLEAFTECAKIVRSQSTK